MKVYITIFHICSLIAYCISPLKSEASSLILTTRVDLCVFIYFQLIIPSVLFIHANSWSMQTSMVGPFSTPSKQYAFTSTWLFRRWSQELSTLAVGSYVWVACNAIISSRLNKIEKQLLKIPWNVRKMPIQFTFLKWMLKSIVNVHSNSPKRQLLSHVRLWILIQSLQVCLRLTYFTIFISIRYLKTQM